MPVVRGPDTDCAELEAGTLEGASEAAGLLDEESIEPVTVR